MLALAHMVRAPRGGHISLVAAPKPGLGDLTTRKQIAIAFERWWTVARDQIPDQEILDAMFSGNPGIIMDRRSWRDAWQAAEADWESAALDLLTKTGAKEIARLGFSFSFGLDNPHAQAWARDHGAELVQNVDGETRRAIAWIVEDGLIDGVPPLDTARAIRPLIGLTEAHARAAKNQLAGLVDNGVPPDRAMAQSARYADRLLRYRADNIARTETVAAQAGGLDSAWSAAQDRGLLAATAEREWIAATGGDRTCEICSELDGQRAPLGESFQSTVLGEAVDRPPAHPACRCSMGLVS